MKKLIIGLTSSLFVSMLLVGNTFGITQVFTVAAGEAWNATNFFPQSARITAISIATGSGGASNLIFAFNDFPGINVANGWGGIKQTNTGYMQLSSYLTNILKIQTNFGGVYTNRDGTTNWITVSNVLWTYTNYLGATSNSWRVIAAGSAGSNGAVVTMTIPSSGINVVYGLGFTNNNVGVATSITITYDPAL